MTILPCWQKHLLCICFLSCSMVTYYKNKFGSIRQYPRNYSVSHVNMIHNNSLLDCFTNSTVVDVREGKAEGRISEEFRFRISYFETHHGKQCNAVQCIVFVTDVATSQASSSSSHQQQHSFNPKTDKDTVYFLNNKQ